MSRTESTGTQDFPLQGTSRSMQYDAEIIIVGAGLAGASAALVLSSFYDVRILEANRPAAGASGAAAGLVNPFMGRRARPVWRPRDALNALSDLLERADAADLLLSRGVVRPALDSNQATTFREVARENPDLATWLSADRVRERYPSLLPDRGALFIPKGGAVDVEAMVQALLDAATADGATMDTNSPVLYWRETPDAAVVELDRGKRTEELQAECVLLTLGQGFPPFPELRRLGLEGVKGQTVRVSRPSHLTDPLPPLSGRGYIVPDTEDTLVLGSNYDHDFDDLEPKPETTAYIQEKTSKMIAGLDGEEILEERAGVRVMHPSTNMPLLGPLPDRSRIWTFTALGSKGLLTAPLLSQDLPDYLKDPDRLPDRVRPSG